MKLKNFPRLMLISRITRFFLVQAAFALVFYLSEKTSVWDNSTNWWLLTVTTAHLVCLFLLIYVFRAEGQKYWHNFRIDRQHVWGDLLALVIVILVTAPLTYLPNILLGKALFGGSFATLNLFMLPLPLWMVYIAIIACPIAQGLTEPPSYFGYVMPCFESQGISKWLAISIPAPTLGLHHIASPFLLNGRFIVWRGLMFIPFAFLTGIAFHWRPRLLPYFVVPYSNEYDNHDHIPGRGILGAY